MAFHNTFDYNVGFEIHRDWFLVSRFRDSPPAGSSDDGEAAQGGRRSVGNPSTTRRQPSWASGQKWHFIVNRNTPCASLIVIQSLAFYVESLAFLEACCWFPLCSVCWNLQRRSSKSKLSTLYLLFQARTRSEEQLPLGGIFGTLVDGEEEDLIEDEDAATELDLAVECLVLLWRTLAGQPLPQLTERRCRVLLQEAHIAELKIRTAQTNRKGSLVLLLWTVLQLGYQVLRRHSGPLSFNY
ncbi:hypothetical protein M9H77_23119 [Catharanthus roseus]|uniref:Uncharacterized protein n=1 Tax=Catharanthus roseus TaxID=4058 RepID=A0ACC0AWF8_CATRO|nr:hypothetical protein M9H77_23119 [Catharanthus roseus]